MSRRASGTLTNLAVELPPPGRSQPKKKKVMIQLNPEEFESLRRFAEERGEPFSTTARLCVLAVVEAWEEKEGRGHSG